MMSDQHQQIEIASPSLPTSAGAEQAKDLIIALFAATAYYDRWRDQGGTGPMPAPHRLCAR
jgi:hypothetical protein